MAELQQQTTVELANAHAELKHKNDELEGLAKQISVFQKESLSNTALPQVRNAGSKRASCVEVDDNIGAETRSKCNRQRRK